MALQVDSCCCFLIKVTVYWYIFCWRPRSYNGQLSTYLQDPCCCPWRESLASKINSWSSQNNFLFRKKCWLHYWDICNYLFTLDIVVPCILNGRKLCIVGQVISSPVYFVSFLIHYLCFSSFHPWIADLHEQRSPYSSLFHVFLLTDGNPTCRSALFMPLLTSCSV